MGRTVVNPHSAPDAGEGFCLNLRHMARDMQGFLC